ncbi:MULTISPECIES: hypothetical protein [Sporolactobacillus]|uniref:hypothetical protein n=1 Tax=Sporolactobacillus TaxID=2077 RepID=UPI00048AF439|nr:MULTISPECIES: hypothetical protein [Sporolactobacillus]
MKAHVFYGGNTCVCLAEHSVVAAYKLAGITYNPLLSVTDPSCKREQRMRCPLYSRYDTRAAFTLQHLNHWCKGETYYGRIIAAACP